ncbi:Hypothetical predicted protein [Cloeon dipterum]|uniref:Uncharacterized protein n=1 Tax=Cloeon dipterum TaxID=197152 RepID=A0A8S1C8U8_9INSE|nr:Hypothetical predicted protein [Cloeon dipterum]
MCSHTTADNEQKALCMQPFSRNVNYVDLNIRCEPSAGRANVSLLAEDTMNAKVFVWICLFVLSGFAAGQLSPSSVAKCGPGFYKKLFRRHDLCVIKAIQGQGAILSAYIYKCYNPKNTTQFDFRNVIRFITSGSLFKGRFSIYIFTKEDVELQNYHSCIPFDRCEGLFLTNFTTPLPPDFYVESNFENAAGYCHPDVI